MDTLLLRGIHLPHLVFKSSLLLRGIHLPHLVFKSSLLLRGIHPKPLPHLVGVWRGSEGASTSSAPELRRVLQDYEGGCAPPKHPPRSRTRNKPRKHTPKLLAVLQALEEEGEETALDDSLSENEQGMLLDAQWRCDRALALFARLKAQPGYVPSTCHYTIMLKKCGRARKWGKVRELVAEMEERGVGFNSWTFNTLIDVCEKAGRTEEATEWFERSRRAGCVDEVGLGSEIRVLKGDAGRRLFESLPRILSEKKKKNVPEDDDEGASSASSAMRAKKVDTYNIMMDLHGKAGDFQRASATFQEMVEAGVAPDIVTYNTMIHICGRSGRVREAKALFHRITAKGLVPDVATYNTMMSMFLRRGEKERALGYYQRMKAAGVSPDAFTFQILLRHCVVDVKETNKHIASLMEELAAGVGERVVESELVQTIMVSLYKYAGMKEQALAAARTLRDGELATTLPAFNSVLEMSQSLSEAKETLAAMQRSRVHPDVSTYNRMAGVLKRVGLYHEALEAIQDADAAGLPFNLHILTTAASLYSHVGMHEAALDACSAMRKCGSPLDAAAYNAMVYAFGNAGRVDEAVRVSMEMAEKRVEADVVTHTTVITVYAKMGLVEGVSRVYKRMKKAQCEPDEVTYKMLISVYKEAGREDLAAMVFQERQFARYLAKQFKEAPLVAADSADGEEEQQEVEE